MLSAPGHKTLITVRYSVQCGKRNGCKEAVLYIHTIKKPQEVFGFVLIPVVVSVMMIAITSIKIISDTSVEPS